MRIFIEAEDGIADDLAATPPDSLWLNNEGMASGLRYIWQRRGDKADPVTYSVNIPRAGDYFVYARVKGDSGATFTIAGQSITAPAGKTWQWIKSSGAATLTAEAQSIAVSSNKMGSRLDCFYLSTDGDFTPAGRIIADPPKQLTLSGTKDGDHPKLTWPASANERFSHYNLYVGATADFTPGQASLVASPDGTSYIDWQALSGEKYYKLTQVTRDGLESEPSEAVRLD